MDEHAAPAWRHRVWPALRTCAVLIVVAGYYALRFRDCILTFFALDDFWLLDAAAHIHAIPEVFVPGRGTFVLYRPLSQVGYFYLLRRLFDYDASAYHAVQLGVHVLNALLVFGIVRRLTTSSLGALAGAMFYAAAPGHVVAIYWLAAFAMTGSSLVVLATVYCWLCTDGVRRIVGCTFLQVVGLLTSEHTVVIPVLLAVVSVLGPSHERPGRVARQLAGPVALVAVYLGAKVWYFEFIDAFAPGYAVDFDPVRWLEHLARYAGACVNVLALATVPERVHLLGGLAIAVVLAVSVWQAWRGAASWRLLAVGTATFVVCLLPVLPLKDHYFDYYVGTAGLGAAVAFLGVCRLLTRSWAGLAAGLVATLMLVDVATAGSAARRSPVYLLVAGSAAGAASWVQAIARAAAGAEDVLVPRNAMTEYVFGMGHAQDLFSPVPVKLTLFDPAHPPAAAPGAVEFRDTPAPPSPRDPLPGWKPRFALLRRFAGRP